MKQMKKTLLMMMAVLGLATIFSSCTKEEEAPTAAFTVNTTQVGVGDDVYFYDNSEGEITSYSWSFPGGTPETSTDKNPVVYYSNPGFYSVSLSVTNEGGSNSISNEDLIEVLAGPPTANFSASSTLVNVGEEITFYDESTGNPTSWIWTISGGGLFEVITDQNATVTPDAPGMITVSLFVANEYGDDIKEVEDYAESYAPGLTIYNNAPSSIKIEYEGETEYLGSDESLKIYDPNYDNSLEYKVTTLASYGTDLSSGWETADLSSGDQSIEFDVSYEYFFLKIENNSFSAFDKLVVNAGTVSEVTVNEYIGWADDVKWIGYFPAFSNTVIEAHFQDNNSYIYWSDIPWSSLGSSNIVLDLVYDGKSASLKEISSNQQNIQADQTILLK
jgi:PKD repeat protein